MKTQDVLIIVLGIPLGIHVCTKDRLPEPTPIEIHVSAPWPDSFVVIDKIKVKTYTVSWDTVKYNREASRGLMLKGGYWEDKAKWERETHGDEPAPGDVHKDDSWKYDHYRERGDMDWQYYMETEGVFENY